MKNLQIAIVFSASFVIAQGIEDHNYEAFRFLEFGIGTRTIGMGNAVVATTEDVYAIFWNPSKLAKIDGRAISTSLSYLYHRNSKTGFPFAGFTKPQIAFSFSVGPYGAVGLGGFYLDYGDDVSYLHRYENIGSIAPGPVYDENIFCLGYGNEITTDFAVGISFMLYQLFTPKNKIFSDSSKYGFSVGLGSYYSVTPQISLGLLYNGGASIFSHKSAVYQDSIIEDTTEFRIPIQAKAIFGIAYNPINNLLLEFDIKTKERVNPFKLYIGGEYSYYPLKKKENGPIGIKVRFGVRDLLGKEEFEAKKKVSNYAFTAGAGFMYDVQFIRGSLDYAQIYRPNLHDVNIGHLSHTLSFGLKYSFLKEER